MLSQKCLLSLWALYFSGGDEKDVTTELFFLNMN